MEESFLSRTAFAAESSMVMNSAGVMDLDRQAGSLRMQSQLAADGPFQAHQNYADLQFFGGPDRSLNFALGSVIAPHGIDRNGQHGRARGYSSATSITSRPLYFPQCGQTRWGSLGSWQLGQLDITVRGR